MRLATEATGVRLPASVETSAKESHARCGSASLGTQCAASSTNGTLLTSWQAATVNRPKRNVWCAASAPKSGASASWMRSVMPACATPCVTTKSAAKKSRSVPSTCANISLGGCREASSKSPALVIAVHARLCPRRKRVTANESASTQRSASGRSRGGGGTSGLCIGARSSRRKTTSSTRRTQPSESSAGNSSILENCA